ncbi:HTH-type transcriptional repressor Bm3R1 [Flavobacterium sp. ACN2]|jgi:AcrR family transcriptional regulator|uniref:TetR/AcrR family transcriptional regulator n=1 Tax=unclassified Flavobacterium TaxID=196869 RepID=UPI000BB3D383|nr:MULTISPECIES: TetR/AcrR family transcriptional regulator [unclassified Flavobacterium]MDY0988229.1 TetR/AcrR family transcriptional regulator [Flavobacterium sp. CFBP9031]PBI90186.1 HTH-type transcriptional repressor Bm3R1 [Flavobacterium sp. ACN2]
MRPLDPDKREKILKSVYVLTGKQGLASVTISGISKTAEVAAGTLYIYFKNKEEVVQLAYAAVEDKMTQAMYRDFDINLPVRQSLKKIYINMLNYRLNHYDETVFIDQYQQSGYIQLNFSKQLAEYEKQNKPLYDLLGKGQREGIIKALDAIILISFFDGAVRSCSTGIIQKLFPLSQQLIDDCFDLVWRGIS